MTTHHDRHDQLVRLAAREPAGPGSPDVAAIRRAGHRIRLRRRVTGAAAAVAAVAAVGVPVALVGSSPLDSSTPSAPDPSGPAAPAASERATADPSEDRGLRTLPPGCGVLGCPDDRYGAPETGQVVGEPWKIGEMADGTDELIYAVRPAPGVGVFIAAGSRDERGLHQEDLAFRPGRERSPGPLHLHGGVRRQGPDGATYTVLGLVDHETTNVAWRSGNGRWNEVDGGNTELVPGYTVFWFIDDWDESWDPGANVPVTVRVDGVEMTADHM